MRVKELIEALQKMPQEYYVHVGSNEKDFLYDSISEVKTIDIKNEEGFQPNIIVVVN